MVHRIVRTCVLLSILTCVGVDAMLFGRARDWTARELIPAAYRTSGGR